MPVNVFRRIGSREGTVLEVMMVGECAEFLGILIVTLVVGLLPLEGDAFRRSAGKQV